MFPLGTPPAPRQRPHRGRRWSLSLLLPLALTAVGCATNPYPPTRKYHATSQRLEEEIFYDHQGRRHGTCRTWYDSGVLRSRSVFAHGKLVSFEMWSQDSQKIRLQ